MYLRTSTLKASSIDALRVSALALIVSASLCASGAFAQVAKPLAAKPASAAPAAKDPAPALCPITPPGAKSPASCPAKPQDTAQAQKAPTLAAAAPFAHRPLHARTAPTATTLAVAKPKPRVLTSVPLTLTPLPMEGAPVEAVAQAPTPEAAPQTAVAAATQAQPQIQPKSPPTPLQTRGLSTGQDVASLGLANENGFSVKGVGDGQSLSALNVNMPSLIHQILANDEARSAVTATPAPPPEETTPEFLERMSLSRQLMRVDGSDDLIRHLVNKVHMKLIVNEVNKYLNINSLPETERYRLSAIVATAASDLSERILNLNARSQARMLTKAELTELIGSLDVESQRKLTRMRLEDDGTLDKQAELEIQLAQLNIIKAYERR